MVYYMTSKHPVIAVEKFIGWRRVPFVSFFLVHQNLKWRLRYWPWKARNWWNLVKAHTCIGHIDNRRHLSNVSKKFQSKGKTGYCRIRKVQFIPQFYFSCLNKRDKKMNESSYYHSTHGSCFILTLHYQGTRKRFEEI